MKAVFGVKLPGDPDEDINEQCPELELIQEAAELFDKFTNEEVYTQDVLENESLHKINSMIREAGRKFRSSRTSSLWLNFCDMVMLLKKFLKAERTGNWNLHLSTLQEMLPIFAATGHNLYTKSVYMYLLNMQNLQTDHPDVYSHFQNGHHVLRRSDRFWAGLSTDLVIEQVLMRSIKSCGGLTRGRGLEESQRALWLLSMPVCAEYNNAMQDLTGTTYSTSDQHKESSPSRIARDQKDIKSLLEFLADRNPFLSDTSLRNIETGEIAVEKVNADKALDIGQSIIASMTGQNVVGFSFKKSCQIVPLGTKTDTANDMEINIDPQLMFQRLITAAKDLTEDPAEIFKYELSGVPSSLFDNNGLPRLASKSLMSEAIWGNGQCGAEEIPDNNLHYIVDGGSLLQRIPWTKGDSFSSICQTYCDHVKRKYSDSVTVVFDSYPDHPTTKDVTHMRRTKGISSPTVNFEENMPFKTKKDIFLANKCNKQKFINLLCSWMEKNSIHHLQADGDADYLIAKTAVEMSKETETIVIGEDTDLLVLLCHHADPNSHRIVFKSGKNVSGKKKIWDIQKTITILGTQVCKLLPFIHAVTGCDTTSRLYSVGKAVALKKAKNDKHFTRQGEIFMNTASTKKDVIKAGEEAVVCLYGGVPYEGTDILRWRKFTSKAVVGHSFVQIQSLPPTSNALQFQSLRVFKQCQEWSYGDLGLDPLNFGWKITNGKLVPIKTSFAPAPEELMTVLRCNCKQQCDTRRCTCRKNGLQCSIACGECRGVNCSNSTVTEEDISGH